MSKTLQKSFRVPCWKAPVSVVHTSIIHCPGSKVMRHFHPFRLPCISFHLPFLPSRHHPMSRGEPDPPDIINTLTFLVGAFFGENTNWTSIGGGLYYLFRLLLCTLFNLIHATQGKNDRFGAPSPDGELRVRMVLESSGHATATQLGSPESKVLSFTCHRPWPGYSTNSTASQLRSRSSWVNHPSVWSVSSASPVCFVKGFWGKACRERERWVRWQSFPVSVHNAEKAKCCGIVKGKRRDGTPKW